MQGSQELKPVSMTSRVVDKAGVIGVLAGSFGCVACFPAIASIGAAIGLGFLGQWEGVAVRFVVPVFAIIVLLANLAGWFSHRCWQRAVIGAAGPMLVLLGAFGLMGFFRLTHGFLPADVARGIFYAGLVLMLLVAARDLLRPAAARCRIDDGVTHGAGHER